MLRVNSFLYCVSLRMFGFVYGWVNIVVLGILLGFISYFSIAAIINYGK